MSTLKSFLSRMPVTEDKSVSWGRRNMYLVFVRGSQHRDPSISWMTGMTRNIFHPDEACLIGSLDSFRMRDWSSERPRHNWRFRTYILISPCLARGEGPEIELITNGQWLHQSGQCKEASAEAYKDRAWRAPGLVTMCRCGRRRTRNGHGSSTPSLHTLHPVRLCHLAVPKLCLSEYTAHSE